MTKSKKRYWRFTSVWLLPLLGKNQSRRWFYLSFMETWTATRSERFYMNRVTTPSDTQISLLKDLLSRDGQWPSGRIVLPWTVCHDTLMCGNLDGYSSRKRSGSVSKEVCVKRVSLHFGSLQLIRFQYVPYFLTLLLTVEDWGLTIRSREREMARFIKYLCT